jgi:hypothetical protein
MDLHATYTTHYVAELLENRSRPVLHLILGIGSLRKARLVGVVSDTACSGLGVRAYGA